MEDLTGKQLGPYQLIAPLGEGGMAVVYKAYQPSIERYVALKILPRLFALEPNFVSRFKQEARIIASLEHPNIMPIYDYGEAEGYTYIVMRYIEGGRTLADLLHGQPLPLSQISDIIFRIAEALDYAHSREIIHRDVKPSNVLIDQRGHLLLSDFGLAKMLMASIKLTTSGAFVGTPTYASPELCLGRHDIDGRSDVYSLGVMLYEMATGRLPFEAETPMAVVVKHISDPLPMPRKINPTLPESMERIILKALAKDREGRYRVAGDLARALAKVVARESRPKKLLSLPAILKRETVTQKKPVRPPAEAAPLVMEVEKAQPPTTVPVEQMPTVPEAEEAQPPTTDSAELTPTVPETDKARPTITAPPSQKRKLFTWKKTVETQAEQTPTVPETERVQKPVALPHARKYKRTTRRELPKPSPRPLVAGSEAGKKPPPAALPASQRTTRTRRRLSRSLIGIGALAGIAFLVGMIFLIGRFPVFPAARFTPSPQDISTTLTSTLTKTAARTETRTAATTPTLTLTPFRRPTLTPTLLLPVPTGTSLPRPAQVILPENAGQLMQFARLGNGPAYGVAWSPDGKVLAVASPLGIYFYNPFTYEQVFFIDTPADSIAFSPDGKTLASAWENTIRLWQISDRTLLYTLEGHTDHVNSMAFSRDGRTLASGADDNSARLWRVSDGTLLHTLAHSYAVTNVAFVADGKTLASFSLAGSSVRFWQASDGTFLYMLQLSSDVVSVAFSPDGQTAASGWRSGIVDLWRVSDGSLLYMMRVHTGRVQGLVFSPDGQILASGSESQFRYEGPGVSSWKEDDTIRLWQVSDGTLLHTLEVPGAGVTSLAFSPNGRNLASGYKGLWGNFTTGQLETISDTVRIWQVSDGALLHTLEWHASGMYSIVFSPDGKILAAGSKGGRISLWQVFDYTPLHTWDASGPSPSLAFSPNGVTLASGSFGLFRGGSDATCLWQVSDGTLLRVMEGRAGDYMTSVAFSPDGQILVAGLLNKSLRMWRVSDGLLVLNLGGFKDFVRGAIFSPDGQILAVLSGGVVRFLRASNGDYLRTLESRSVVTSFSFSLDGTMLAAGTSDGSIQLWRVTDGTLLRTMAGHAGGVNSVAFSPDGETLASGAQDHTARLWRVQDGTPLHTIDTLAIVNSVAFSPDGKLLALGLEDGTIHLWGVWP